MLLGAAGTARADGEFNVNAVFALPPHNDVDGRCVDARRFADLAAKPGIAFDTQSAWVGEQAFEWCVKLPSIKPDSVTLRYLILGAAAAAYMGAQTSNDDALALELYRLADSYAQSIGGNGPTIPWDRYYANVIDPSTVPGYMDPSGMAAATATNESGTLGHASLSSHWQHERQLFADIPQDAITKSASAMRASIAAIVPGLAEQKKLNPK